MKTWRQIGVLIQKFFQSYAAGLIHFINLWCQQFQQVPTMCCDKVISDIYHLIRYRCRKAKVKPGFNLIFTQPVRLINFREFPVATKGVSRIANRL